MANYIKIGRDIIVGKGFKAKHWAGPVVFGRDAIYVCPNASEMAVKQGLDSGAAALGFLGVAGGAVAGLITGKKGEAQQPGWQDHIVDLPNLPAEVLSSLDWPVKKKRRPVVVLRRDQIEKVERSGGRLLVSVHGETFKLGMKFFGRGKVLEVVRELGWAV